MAWEVSNDWKGREIEATENLINVEYIVVKNPKAGKSEVWNCYGIVRDAAPSG